MDPSVKALGYLVIETTQFEQWKRFGTFLCGMQIADESDDVVRFRVDEKLYRVEVRRADRDRIAVIGWEVSGPAELRALQERLDAAGHPTRRETPEKAAERGVIELVSFADPDGLASIELYYGLTESLERFASPVGNTFVAGEHGLGHVLQVVSDREAYWKLYVDVLGMKFTDLVNSPKRQADLLFFHCNARHHSFAFAEIDGVEPGVGHMMLEVSDLDAVGRAYDKVLDGEASLITTFGKHTNDEMLSFYVRTPSGFGLEFGTGGLLVDDDWRPARYEDAHYWGHRRGETQLSLLPAADVD
ncbi:MULTISPECIES: VOC family protein [Rhodococcus]|uniref:VOC family protein n=1 Tax=Rhodococcus TaxID=1827 RepID=UPI00132EF6E5|nr:MULTISPECIES: VOC family protein [Rhodococcus]QHG84747.1 glyoxalase [Rhodococcus rhodochrous]QOH58946.1 glyoxalase [Rhodococcus rhodochrous]WAL47343.1 VOC family protein [Rhodococcus pyridinivorans]